MEWSSMKYSGFHLIPFKAVLYCAAKQNILLPLLPLLLCVKLYSQVCDIPVISVVNLPINREFRQLNVGYIYNSDCSQVVITVQLVVVPLVVRDDTFQGSVAAEASSGICLATKAGL